MPVNGMTLAVAAAVCAGTVLTRFLPFWLLPANKPLPAWAAYLARVLPPAVMGGVSIILFGMIAAVGLRTLVENQVDFENSRNLMIVAVMLVLGLGGAALNFSFTYKGVPGEIALSGAALAAVVGIILNKAMPEKAGKEEA